MKVMPPTVGPILGATACYSARIFVRGAEEISAGKLRRVHGVLRMRNASEPDGARPNRFFKLNPNFDLTGVAVVEGLSANTTYSYRSAGSSPIWTAHNWILRRLSSGRGYSNTALRLHRMTNGSARSSSVPVATCCGSLAARWSIVAETRRFAQSCNSLKQGVKPTRYSWSAIRFTQTI